MLECNLDMCGTSIKYNKLNERGDKLNQSKFIIKESFNILASPNEIAYNLHKPVY